MKRHYPFATLPLGQSDLIRELVVYRAHVDTIKALLPHPHVEQVARTYYDLIPDKNTPRGSTPSIVYLLSKRYANMSARLALHELLSQFDDLRKSDFSFQESLIYIYRSYFKKNQVSLKIDSAPTAPIRFEHLYCIALELESRQATLFRCSCCGSRNLLTKHLSSHSLPCIFCKIADIASKPHPHVKHA